MPKSEQDQGAEYQSWLAGNEKMVRDAVRVGLQTWQDAGAFREGVLLQVMGEDLYEKTLGLLTGASQEDTPFKQGKESGDFSLGRIGVGIYEDGVGFGWGGVGITFTNVGKESFPTSTRIEIRDWRGGFDHMKKISLCVDRMVGDRAYEIEDIHFGIETPPFTRELAPGCLLTRTTSVSGILNHEAR